jgi:hypothetical protein
MNGVPANIGDAGGKMKKTRLPVPLMLFLAFLAGIDTTLKGLALRDLARRDRRVRGGRKAPWVPIIAGINTFGWLAYFRFGRIPSDPHAGV